jgi:hypothetical protein
MFILGTNTNFYSLHVNSGNINLSNSFKILDDNIFINSDFFINKNAIFNNDLIIQSSNSNKLIVNSDASFNGSVFFGESKFINGGILVLNKDASFNNNISINGDAIFNKVYVRGDVSFNGNIYITGGSVIDNDGKITINKDISLNSNVIINNNNNGSYILVNADSSFNGNINFNGNSKISNTGVLTMNSDAYFNATLNVNDTLFNGNVIFEGGDTITKKSASFNNILFNLKNSIFNIENDFYLTSQNLNTIFTVAVPSIFQTNVNFQGDVNSVYQITFGSDYRIKTDIIPLCDTDFTVDSLNPVFYHNIVSKTNDIGFIAHELQEHLPFLVNGEKDGEQYQSVNYNGLIGLLVSEIQSLKKRVSQLENNMVV